MANVFSMGARLEFALMKSCYRTRDLKFAEVYALTECMERSEEVEIYVARSGVE